MQCSLLCVCNQGSRTQESTSRNADQKLKSGAFPSDHDGGKERVNHIEKTSVPTPPTAPNQDSSPAGRKAEHAVSLLVSFFCMHCWQSASASAASSSSLAQLSARVCVDLFHEQVADSAHLYGPRMPQHIHEAQHELTVAAEVDEQRRLAAVVSRARSRIVSRAEASAGLDRFADRADVAKAAAEQLRKMEAASRKKVKRATQALLCPQRQPKRES